MKKKAIAAVIITILCIAVTVFLRITVDRGEPEYEEVEATVISSETRTKKVLGNYYTYYDVMVIYDGQEYELRNPHNSYSFIPGRKTDAFLSEGKLYANIEGIKTSTPLAKAYFVFLFGSVAMVVVSVTSICKARG